MNNASLRHTALTVSTAACATRRRATPARAAALAALALAGSAAMAAEYGTVISSTAINAQVGVPQQQCVDQQQVYQQRPSGGGALLGAVVGGVLGNAVGGGFGRAAATGLGVVAGAAVGDNVEAANAPATTATVRRCNTVTRYENRVIGYDVVYDYNGQRYATRVAQLPGERIALNVNVVPAEGALQQAAPAFDAQQQPLPVQQVQPAYTTTMVEPAPVYYDQGPGYGYGYGYYGGPLFVPRVVIGFGGGYYRHGGYYGHGHGRWR